MTIPTISQRHTPDARERLRDIRQDRRMTTAARPRADATVGVRMTSEEKAQLAREAAAEGVTLSTLVWRRAFNRPHAIRRQGNQPKHTVDDEIEGFGMTG